MPGDATVEEMLDTMSQVPGGLQAMLVEAVKDLGKDLVQAQQQAFATLSHCEWKDFRTKPLPVRNSVQTLELSAVVWTFKQWPHEC